MPSSSLLRHALILGLISAIGPFAIDMYLPAMPQMAQALGASAAEVQMSLTAFFVALGLCQMLYGPLSDRFGRRGPMAIGLGLFVLGSLGCALAPDARTLIAMRFVAGVGACASMVIPRAVVRDLHTGVEAARLGALLMLVFSVSPILAPVAGSLVVALAGWRWIFGCIVVLGLLALGLVLGPLEESRPVEARRGTTLAGTLAAVGTLLRDGHFRALALTGAFAMSGFMAYLGHSSFVMIEHHGVTPTQYGLLFGLNAIAFIGAAQLNVRLCRRLGLARVVQLGLVGYLAASALLLALTAAGIDRLEMLVALLFVAYGFLGLVAPTVPVMALDHHGEIAGTASALIGTFQMVCGAAVMSLVSVLGGHAHGALPMVAAVAGCALVALLIGGPALRQPPRLH
ncbi:MAG: transporter, family, multidrug resistance protein [Pseudomonadota bacterium]|nr:transporter, family, multidrug resistance protein [Pseudomonadota bacterium]